MIDEKFGRKYRGFSVVRFLQKWTAVDESEQIDADGA